MVHLSIEGCSDQWINNEYKCFNENMFTRVLCVDALRQSLSHTYIKPMK